MAGKRYDLEVKCCGGVTEGLASVTVFTECRRGREVHAADPLSTLCVFVMSIMHVGWHEPCGAIGVSTDGVCVAGARFCVFLTPPHTHDATPARPLLQFHGTLS